MFASMLKIEQCLHASLPKDRTVSAFFYLPKDRTIRSALPSGVVMLMPHKCPSKRYPPPLFPLSPPHDPRPPPTEPDARRLHKFSKNAVSDLFALL